MKGFRLRNRQQLKASAVKDVWDKLEVISKFLSGVLIAGLVAYFTYSYNKIESSRMQIAQSEKNRVIELQTIEKFIPHLIAENEDSRKIAVMAVSSLGNPDLAAKLAKLYETPGTTSALQSMAISDDPDVSTPARSAIFNSTRIFRSIEKRAYTKLVSAKGQLLGWGIFVSPDGHVLTSSNLTDTSNIFYSSNESPAPRLLEREKEWGDIAILKLNLESGEHIHYINLRNISDSQVNDDDPVLVWADVFFGVVRDISIGKITSTNNHVYSVGFGEKDIAQFVGSPAYGYDGKIIGILSAVKSSGSQITPNRNITYLKLLSGLND